jgi:predicted ATPase/DNA-binding CsgD family transcriptional regulator
MRGDGLPHALARAGVTQRETEVLWAVAERLRNREIADRLQLSVRTVESHIASLLRKLAVDDRAALVDLGLHLRQGARVQTALPVPLTSLVGRDDETRAVSTLVGTHRLVTLTGPGGVGKTRVALQVATWHADQFPDGVRFADLAPVAPELVGDTMASALGVAPQPGWPLRDILREAATGMRCLVLVDNCEHVVDEAAEIITDLLTAGPELRVLATSREPLGVPGEVSFQVPPLPVPTSADAISADAAVAFDAVRLFVDRASTALPGFILNDAAASAIVTLCQRLDGLPLAIELAASRVRTFAAVELVEHLDQRFELLSAGARTVPQRQRTLRATIDWSYGLLDDDERMLFDRLGVFPADFDFDAVAAVCGAGAGAAALALLPRLLDKSLVSVVREGRFRLLETIRAYAAERLAASPDEPAIRRRHAAYFLGLAERGAQHLRGPQQRVWLDKMIGEQPNVRAAHAHDIAARDMATAWRWIAARQRFWDITGQRREAREWIGDTLAFGDPPPSPAVVAGLCAASAMLHPSDAHAAFDLANRAAALADGLDDITRAIASRAVGMGAMWVQPDLAAPALHAALAGFDDEHRWDRALTMQHLALVAAELPEALGWGQASVALFRDVGDQMYAANTLFIMAQRSIYAGIATDEVHELLTESQKLADAAGSEEDQAHATVGFGQLAWLRGDHEGAARLMEDCLPTLRRMGDQRCTGRALYTLGVRARQRQDLTLAERLLSQSVAAVVLAGQSFVLVNALEELAAVSLDQGRPRDAAVLLGAAGAARHLASVHMRPAQPSDESLPRSIEGILGAEVFTAAYAEGQRLSPTQALRLAP